MLLTEKRKSNVTDVQQNEQTTDLSEEMALTYDTLVKLKGGDFTDKEFLTYSQGIYCEFIFKVCAQIPKEKSRNEAILLYRLVKDMSSDMEKIT